MLVSAETAMYGLPVVVMALILEVLVQREVLAKHRRWSGCR